MVSAESAGSSASGAGVEVRRNADELRYEAWVDQQLAGLLYYSDMGKVRTLLHTEVLHGHEGKGVGGALVRYSLDELRANGRKVRLSCPFAERWESRHPEYDDMVAKGMPGPE